MNARRLSIGRLRLPLPGRVGLGSGNDTKGSKYGKVENGSKCGAIGRLGSSAGPGKRELIGSPMEGTAGLSSNSPPMILGG